MSPCTLKEIGGYKHVALPELGPLSAPLTKAE